MCGIAGLVSLNKNLISNLTGKLKVMSNILEHRGPDGDGQWLNEENDVGFMHRRLAIIDLSKAGAQPMKAKKEVLRVINKFKEL